MKNKINIAGVLVDPITRDALLKSIDDLLSGTKKNLVIKANSEFLLRAIRDKEFKNTINSAEICLADGIGVLWAAKFLSLPIQNHVVAIWQAVYTLPAIIFYPKYLKDPLPETIPGVEALKIMLKSAQDVGAGVYFFGASQEDLDRALTEIGQEFPSLNICGSLNGYDWHQDSSIDPVGLINKTEAKLLIVALGSPQQEYWIRDNFDKLKNVRVAVGEGGSLAFLGGAFKRAPKWLNRIGLEWLWRLFMNKSLTPNSGSRLKRVWNAVPVFIIKTISYKFRTLR